MKRFHWTFAALPLALSMAHAASASTTLYDNGPINGTIDAFSINSGVSVSDSFVLTSASSVTGVNFGVWNYSGDTVSSVDWTISSDPLGGGTLYGSGSSSVTSTFQFSNRFGYELSQDSFSFSGLNLSTGSYYLTLGNAVATNGDPTYWDENNGPSSAFQSGPASLANYDIPNTSGSEAFQVLGPSSNVVPETSQTASLAFGLFGVGGLIFFARKRQTNTA